MQKPSASKIPSILKSPWFVMLFASIVIITLNILFIGKIRPFNSDDVYWQLAVRSWQPFSGDTFYFGAKDIFVILGPYFAVLEHIFPHGRKLLILEALVLTTSSFVLFYFSSLYFLKKIKIRLSYGVLLPFAWLASFGYPMVSWYLNSNWRSFEMGLSFATFALVAAVCNKDIRTNSSFFKPGLILAAITSGALMYGDPYYTFFTIVPLFVLIVLMHILKKIDAYRALMLYLMLIGSYFFSKILSLIGSSAGIHINTNAPSTFVAFESIFDNIEGSLHAMFHIFGADFLGRPAASMSTFIAIINAALLCFTLLIAFSYKKYLGMRDLQKISTNALWPIFVVFILALIFITNTISTLAGVDNYRFYMLFAYGAVLLLAIGIGRIQTKKISTVLAILLIVASLANIAQTAHKGWVGAYPEVSVNQGNSYNAEIVKAIEKLGLRKGYSNFWQGNINTYVSDGKIVFLPSVCNEYGETSKFRWLTTASQFKKQADRSFYLLDSYNKYPATCTQEQLIKQFGRPEQIIAIKSGSILVFDYDISKNMP